MDAMHTRFVMATVLLTASLTGLAVSAYLYVWPGAARAPRWLPAPVPEAIVLRPMFPITTRGVEVRRGGTLARTLPRGGIEARAPHALARQFRRNGADPPELPPSAAGQIISDFRDQPILL